MPDPKIINEWIDKADRDFQFASDALKKESGFYELICYHFQQAGEKYLKAYIVANELEFKKIHDLVELIRICQKRNPDFKMLEPEAKFLTDFYLEPRYPDEFITTSYKISTVYKAQKAAGKIQRFVKAILQSF